MKFSAITGMPIVAQITQRCIPRPMPAAQGSFGAGSSGMCWMLLFSRETNPRRTPSVAQAGTNAPHKLQKQAAVTEGSSDAA